MNTPPHQPPVPLLGDRRSRRRLLLGLLAGASGAAVVGRLWQLQILDHDGLALQAEANRTRIEEVAPLRGGVFDSNGRQLADNVPVFDLWLETDRVDIDTLPELASLVGELTEQDSEQLFRTIERATLNQLGRIQLARGIERIAALTAREQSFRFPGLELEARYRRQYSDGREMGQLVGFTGPVPAEARERYLERGINLSEDVGLAGIEMQFQDELRGISGRRMLEVGALNQDVRELHYTAPISGANVHLSIHTQFQRGVNDILERFLGETGAGVVIVLNPGNGDILAMVDYPTYDNAAFASGISDSEFQALVSDPRNPLINHAISGLYPPGSTFKVVAATAALEDGVIDSTTPFECDGNLILPSGWIFHDWLATGHGTVNLHRAISESCNIFFYKISGGDPYAGFLGVRDKSLSRYARGYGFGRPTGIDLPHESAGVVPDSTWKQENLNAPWVTGDTYQAAIGQGFVQVNPLQLVNMYSAIGNRGTIYRPRLVTRLSNHDGATIRRIDPEQTGRIPISPEHLELVRKGLEEAVDGVNGTGFRARTDVVRFAAKTGTAEYSGQRDARGNLPAHAWFAGYAPHDQPEIAFAVLIRDGGEGSNAGALVARDILELYFGGQVPPMRYPNLAELATQRGSA